MKSGFLNILYARETVARETRMIAERHGSALYNWAWRIVGRAITLEERTHCDALNLYRTPVLTQREARLLDNVGRNQQHVIGIQPISSNGFFKLMPIDYERNDWLADSLARGDNVSCYPCHQDHITYPPSVPPPEGYFNRKLHHLCEAVLAMVGERKSYGNITLERAIEYASEWQAKLEREAKTVEGKIQMVYASEMDMGDGVTETYQAVWLLDQQALSREGYLMHHCVGSYADKIDDRRRVYSIRNAEGRSLSTVEFHIDEWNRVRLYQHQGPANTEPSTACNAFVFSLQELIQSWMPVKEGAPVSLATMGFMAHDVMRFGGDAMAGQVLMVGNNGAGWAQGATHFNNMQFDDQSIENLVSALRRMGYKVERDENRV